MSNNSDQGLGGKKVINLDEAERVNDLPVAPNSSQAAELVKQIIEQILINERRRTRNEFIRLSVFFIVFLLLIFGTGVWFARQLLVQLREERRLTEQTWRMLAGGSEGEPSAFNRPVAADKSAAPSDQKITPPDLATPPALNREEIAKLEQNMKDSSELLKDKSQNASVSVRDILQDQQEAIQALRAQLNETRAGQEATPAETRRIDSAKGGSSGGFITAPVAKDLNLRMPIP
jgi:uncharacterized protein YneF (UPF0154 family)